MITLYDRERKTTRDYTQKNYELLKGIKFQGKPRFEVVSGEVPQTTEPVKKKVGNAEPVAVKEIPGETEIEKFKRIKHISDAKEKKGQ